MKKALVLGVLAIFAIGIANVNAQDRTNVQQKPKKTYTKESTAKTVDTKAAPSTKVKDPTSKNVTPISTPMEKPAASTMKGVKEEKMGTSKKVKKEDNPASAKIVKEGQTIDDGKIKAKDIEEKAEAEKMKAAQENAPQNVSGAKKPGSGINNSVPPTPNKGKAKSAKANTKKDK